MTKYCSECGKELPDDKLYCPECGNILDDDENICPKCNKENEINDIYCSKCGYKLTENKNDFIKIPKKYIPLIIIVIIIIAIIGIYISTYGEIENTLFVGANTISIVSVSDVGSENITPTQYSNYSGVSKSYKVVYIAKNNLENISIEIQAYDKNGNHLDNMANWMGLNPLNILCYNDNITQGSTYTKNVVFGSQNTSTVEVDKMDIYVYQNTNNKTQLIDKFAYKNIN